MSSHGKKRLLFAFVVFSFSLILSLLPVQEILTESFFLIAFGASIFLLFLSILLASILKPLRDYALLAKKVVCLGLMILASAIVRPDAGEGERYLYALWVAISGYLVFEIRWWKYDIVPIVGTVISIVLTLIPGYVHHGLGVMSIRGVMGTLFMRKSSNRIGAIYVATFSAISAIYVLPNASVSYFGAFILLFLVSIAYLGQDLIALYRLKVANDAIQEKERELIRLEEKTLKEEIRPHFLLNALNNVRVAYHEGTDYGTEMLQELIALETKIDATSQKDLISLKEEIEIIQGLVRLFSIERKKEIGLLLEIENSDTLIPPMLLEPLVENSLQHSGILYKSNGLVSIKESLVQGVTMIVVSDNGVGNADPRNNRGIGLSNVDYRVHLLNQGTLNVFSDSNGTKIVISYIAPRK